jgi:hypothetical protein
MEVFGQLLVVERQRTLVYQHAKVSFIQLFYFCDERIIDLLSCSDHFVGLFS